MKKAVAEYEGIAGAKVNFDKSEGLQLGAWRGSDTLPEPFRWSDGPGLLHLPTFCRMLCDPSVFYRGVFLARPPPGVKLVGGTGKGGCPGWNLASKEVVLKGQGGGVRCVRLPLYPLPIGCTSSAWGT